MPRRSDSDSETSENDREQNPATDEDESSDSLEIAEEMQDFIVPDDEASSQDNINNDEDDEDDEDDNEEGDDVKNEDTSEEKKSSSSSSSDEQQLRHNKRKKPCHEDEGIDNSNILPSGSKRARKPVRRYRDESYGKLMFRKVSDDDVKAIFDDNDSFFHRKFKDNGLQDEDDEEDSGDENFVDKSLTRYGYVEDCDGKEISRDTVMVSSPESNEEEEDNDDGDEDVEVSCNLDEDDQTDSDKKKHQDIKINLQVNTNVQVQIKEHSSSPQVVCSDTIVKDAYVTTVSNNVEPKQKSNSFQMLSLFFGRKKHVENREILTRS